MHRTSLLLVCLSAAMHVAWNFRLKRAEDPARHLWLALTAAALLFAPAAFFQGWPPQIPPIGWACIAATGVCYGGYYSLTALSYQRGDLSLAYPIARGVAPAVTVLLGVALYGERPSPAGCVGVTCLCAGVLLIALPDLRPGAWRRFGPGASAAVASGFCIAGYSAVDKLGVRYVYPVLYVCLTFLAGSLAQGILLWRRGQGGPFLAEARRSRWGLLVTGLLSLGSYLIILFVLQREPVSYVTPVRSLSVLLSVLLGARLLREGDTRRRLIGAAGIVVGIALIAVWGR